MIENISDIGKIRPIILAGGLGTRLRPRTNYLPKPMLPVCGRPILWYSLNCLKNYGMLPPIVVIAYKGDLIRAFFEGDSIEFYELPNRTMAEAIIEATERDSAEAFLGMSSDVLVPPVGVKEVVKDYYKSGKKDTSLFVNLPRYGHKKWEFCIENNNLQDIRVSDSQTRFERLLLIMTKKSLQRVRDFLGKPIVDSSIPQELRGYQTGWILLLKAMISIGITITSRIVDIPVCNINVPSDFEYAEKFVSQYMEI